jgi:ABC-type phosphate transport system substrate-binding protein
MIGAGRRAFESVRWFITIGLLTGAIVWAVPAHASAAPACLEPGKTVLGEGPGQLAAQTEIWAPAYEALCPMGSKVIYEGDHGNWKGRWNLNGSTGSIDRSRQFLGPDMEAPDATEMNNVLSVAGVGTHLEVIPVAQEAIAIIVHPPHGCSISQIRQVNLEKAFRGVLPSWAAASATGAGCSAPIRRVVRPDSSGMTYQLKHFFFLDNAAKLQCANKTWQELQEPANNTTWPEGCESILPVLRATGSGDAEEARMVAATEGSIGYVSLETAKAFSAMTLNVQSGTERFAAPAASTGEMANCLGTRYTVPAAALPSGSNKDVNWSNVYGSGATTTAYPICTLTWDLAFTDYSNAGFVSGGNLIRDYFSNYVLEKGQNAIEGHWYAPLPHLAEESGNVLAAAKRAAAMVQQ